MRPLPGIAAALGVFALAGFAQDNPDQQRAAAMKMDIDQMLKGAKVLGIEAGIMGPAVKGAPYSADEIHETTQVLADGTRIHNETKTAVYRDGQGRVRRESPGQVMIWDNTSGTSYVLNQSSQTAQKMLMTYSSIKKTAGSDGPQETTSFRVFRRPDDAMPAVKTEQTIVIKNMEAHAVAEGKAQLRSTARTDAKKEALGSQILEGVTCEGARFTNTIEAGVIGNDRPIQSTEERWYSPDLQVNLMIRKNDPRTGEDIVRLTNVRRLEPDPSLFTVPSTYQVK